MLKEFYAKWNESCDEHNADNLEMVLQLVKRLVSSRENILRDPEELTSFMVALGTNNAIRNFVPLHTVVIEIVSRLITSDKIRRGSEIISQVFIDNFFYLWSNSLCTPSFVACFGDVFRLRRTSTTMN